MRWQTKSKIQRAFAALPFGREKLYYLLQKSAGRQRQRPDPRENFKECARMVRRICDLGARIEGARIMEVGTGWALDMPLGLFLGGAALIQTFDLHRYLRYERVTQTLDVIRETREDVKRIFAPVVAAENLERRLDALCQAQTADQVMKLAHIEYFAPADATRTGLPPESVDIQFSYTVFEHIPEEVLGGILREASRVLKKTGFCLHHIDPSDHFAHDDKSISNINFLQFSSEEWDRYAGNQFAYHNRSRATDFERLFLQNGHRLLQFDTYCDQRSLLALKNGFPLHPKYQGMDIEDLCKTTVVAVSIPVGNAGTDLKLPLQ